MRERTSAGRKKERKKERKKGRPRGYQKDRDNKTQLVSEESKQEIKK